MVGQRNSFNNGNLIRKNYKSHRTKYKTIFDIILKRFFENKDELNK